MRSLSSVPNRPSTERTLSKFDPVSCADHWRLIELDDRASLPPGRIEDSALVRWAIRHTYRTVFSSGIKRIVAILNRKVPGIEPCKGLLRGQSSAILPPTAYRS